MLATKPLAIKIRLFKKHLFTLCKISVLDMIIKVECLKSFQISKAV